MYLINIGQKLNEKTPRMLEKCWIDCVFDFIAVQLMKWPYEVKAIE